MKAFLQKYGSWLNILSALMVLTALVLWVVIPTYAQEESDADATEDVVCIHEISEDVAILTSDIMAFLEQHYLAEEPASALYEVAYEKYIEYRDNLYLLIDNYKENHTNWRVSGEEQKQLNTCNTYIQDQLRIVQTLMLNHNTVNANAKQTYTLVKKLKDINDGLRDLNIDFGEMYGTYKLFSDKIPGVVE